MKKALAVSLLFSVLIAAPLLAELQAVVKTMNGKVEVKPADGAWKPAEPKMVIAKGTIVSTGFNAQAVLDLGASLITVRQLTRMTLQELVEKEGKQTTNLELKVGKVQAEVKSTAGVRTEFTLKGPVSTAAVRGTLWDQDIYEVTVYDGTVRFMNLLMQSIDVRAGEASETLGLNFPTSGEDAMQIQSLVSSSTGGMGGQRGSGQGAFTDTFGTPTVTGTITVSWQ